MLKKKLFVLGLILGLSISLQTMSYATENSISDMTSSEKKYVTITTRYYNINYYDIGDYWYSDGNYSGWLYKREATITGNFTEGYKVTYRGWVWKGPFVPNKVNLEKMK